MVMKIGVPRERKSDEYRVGMTPAGVETLVKHGHSVFVENGAGDGTHVPNEAYEAVGAKIVSVDDVWSRADMIVKVKEPIPEEYPRIRAGQVSLPDRAFPHSDARSSDIRTGRLLLRVTPHGR